MRIAYFDCFSGISGDMILGALVDMGLDIDYLRKEFKKLSISGYDVMAKKVEKNHIYGTKVDITVRDKQTHRNLRDINKIIDDSTLGGQVKELSKKIFLRLAKAESKVHNVDINKIHFHEVGAIDSILDIVGVSIGLKKLNIKKAYSSYLPLGTGFVKCSHGLIPIPAPATAQLIRGIPVYSTNVNGELVTPTGAAIITTLTNNFGKMPLMSIDKVSYGAGKSNFEQPNLLRVFTGELIDESDYAGDVTNMIETNIDDMNPEHYEYITQKLFKGGALDVFFTNIWMKKNRPAVKLSVICALEKTNRLIDIIFNETTTLGVRVYKTKRRKLFVEREKVKTKYGEINIKIGKLNNKVKTISPEYEDCKGIAEKNDIPLKDVYDLAKISYFSKQKVTPHPLSHQDTKK